jgi:hypothetical protein
MVWNTVDSPGVELPSLSNLNVNDVNPLYSQYFLKSGQYDVVGFRLNVQTVYDGIIAAINQAVAGGTLGGLTADEMGTCDQFLQQFVRFQNSLCGYKGYNWRGCTQARFFRCQSSESAAAESQSQRALATS